MAMIKFFRCPRCLGPLVWADGLLFSSNCGASYPVRDGIPLFSSSDNFYEGKFIAPTQDGVGWNSAQGKFIDRLYDRFSATRVKHRFTREFLARFDSETLILDIGCGGGNRLLTQYQTIGVDLSLEGLKTAGQIYKAVATAEAKSLPFADSTFDIVNSWDVFGHIHQEEKDSVIEEWKRVLKPGGWMLHIIEADCTAPFFNLVRRDEALFEKYFIEMDGHYGLELPSQITKRFQRAGFNVERAWSYFRSGIFPPEEYAKRLAAGPEYASASRILKVFGAFGAVCANHKQLDRMMSLITGVLGRAANPLLPMDWGSTFFIICQKT